MQVRSDIGADAGIHLPEDVGPLRSLFSQEGEFPTTARREGEVWR